MGRLGGYCRQGHQTSPWDSPSDESGYRNQFLQYPSKRPKGVPINLSDCMGKGKGVIVALPPKTGLICRMSPLGTSRTSRTLFVSLGFLSTTCSRRRCLRNLYWRVVIYSGRAGTTYNQYIISSHHLKLHQFPTVLYALVYAHVLNGILGFVFL